MEATVSDFVVQRLVDWGVDRIYGYPGDGINGLLGALNREEHNGRAVRFIQARHEETAALMACGHAKFTGRLGVCLATSGPGAVHLLNGLYDAKMDHAPVLAITGQAARTTLGGDYQQEVDLHTLFKDVAHEYVHTAMTPEQVRHLIDRAIRVALSERTVTCLVLPKDIQELPFEEPRHEHDTVHSGLGYSAPIVTPDIGALEQAAEVLNAGERVAMLVGAGARCARAELVETAEVLGAGVAKALLGLDVMSDELPYVTGAIGLLGTRPSSELMRHCDTLFVIGSSFPYAEFLPKEGDARGVQIDIDARRIGMRYPMEVNLIGDAAATLRALRPLIWRKEDRSWRERVEGWVADWWALMDQRAHLPADPVNPQLVFWEMSSRLPDKAILSADSGTAADWYARDLRFRDGMLGSVSGGLATMGCGVPYAIAAKFAYPGRVAVACVGDGAMQMNGMAELLTIARHYKEWKDPRLVVLVLNNGELNMVTWEMRAMEGSMTYEASQELPPFDYARFAELAGLRGIRVERPEQVGPAWDAAFASDVPVVIDAVTDPNVPPLPPHITLDQAKEFGMSLLTGDVNRHRILKQALRHLFPTLIRK
jgi:pyruvate dehydrogenase (quinone)